MKRKVLWLFCGLLPACMASRPHERFVPAEEAAWFKLPAELPDVGRRDIPGHLATAMLLAMDGFLPPGTEPPRGATRQQVCLQQRQSYDVEAAPGPEGLVWVSVSLSPGACTLGPRPLLDMGANYAVDTRNWRLLTEEAAKVEFPKLGLPKEGLRRLDGNMVAALQLAMDEFLPREAQPSTGAVQRAPCLYRRDSYDVTAVPAPDAVMLVRFTVNPTACETGESVVDVTTYAIDVRTMRILSAETRVLPR